MAIPTGSPHQQANRATKPRRARTFNVNTLGSLRSSEGRAGRAHRAALPRLLSAAAVALLLGAAPAAAAAAPLATAAPSTHQAAAGAPGADAAAGRSIVAKGTIAVQPNFATLTATPVSHGAKCLLRVESTLALAGTAEGAATGVTLATIDAPCASATTNPPGTFADTFRFAGAFQGTISGAPVTADVEYAGVTRAGGEVSALLTFHGGATLVAEVQARAAGSGTYQGIALAPKTPPAGSSTTVPDASGR